MKNKKSGEIEGLGDVPLFVNKGKLNKGNFTVNLTKKNAKNEGAENKKKDNIK